MRIGGVKSRAADDRTRTSEGDSMRNNKLSWRGVPLTALVGIISCAFATTASAGPTTKPTSGDPDAMLAQIEQIQPPKFDSSKQEDQEYVRSYIEARRKWAAERADL